MQTNNSSNHNLRSWYSLFSIILGMSLSTACLAEALSRSGSTDIQADSLYQLAPTVVLTKGLYEGQTPFNSLLELGDFGLGAISPLDGEIIILEGDVYQAAFPDGRLRKVDESETSPFAYIKRFQADISLNTANIADYPALLTFFDSVLTSSNYPYAIRVDGYFNTITLRSVPRQQPPYPAIDKVVKTQSVYTHQDIQGTLVGIRLPGFLQSVSGQGYHFHFVDQSRSLGGHVLGLEAAALNVSADVSYGMHLLLPEDSVFASAGLVERQNQDAFQRAVTPDRSR